MRLRDRLKRLVTGLRGLVQDTTGARSTIYRPPRLARDELSYGNRQRMLGLSRFFADEMPLVARLAALTECYTVGDQVTIRPRSGEPEWDRRALSMFSEAAKRIGFPEGQSLQTLLSEIVYNWFVDGEAWILFIRDDRWPRLQLLDSVQIETPPQQMVAGRRALIVDGAELDGAGRVAAWWAWQPSSDGRSREWRRLDPLNLYHLYEPERPGQLRGIPFLAPALNVLHDLWDLQHYEMRSARAHSMVAIHKQRKRKSASATLEELYRAGPPISGTSQIHKPLTDEAFPAEIIETTPDENVQLLQSNRPSLTTQEFWRFLMSQVCAAVGIPFQIAFPEHSARIQGTAYRGQIAVADAWFKARFRALIPMLREFWRHVVVNSPGLIPRPERWYEVEFIPPRSIIVDSGYATEEAVTLLQHGLTTRERLYGARGLDWEEELRQLAREEALIRELGLTLNERKTTNGQDDTEKGEDETAE